MNTEVMLDSRNDEIDLLGVFNGLWQQKWLIVGIACLVVAIASLYAFLIVPIYEAEVVVNQPLPGDIANINVGRTEGEELKSYSVKDVYDLFSIKLKSDVSKRQFFETVYWPSLPEEQKGKTKEVSYKQFVRETLKISAPDKLTPELLKVTFQGEERERIADFVNSYVDQVSQQTINELVESVKYEVDIAKRNISEAIESERRTAEKMREDQLARLREALVVAKTIGIEKPQMTVARPPTQDNVAPFIDGSQMYALGRVALQGEIDVLEARKSNDPFIPSLRTLESRLGRLSQINVDAKDVHVFRSYQNAITPELPIKPKKTLIVTLGSVLGGLLGIFVALIRNALQRRSNAPAS